MNVVVDTRRGLDPGSALPEHVRRGESTGPRRIAFLNSHPIQYKAPLYAYLNSARDLDVTALYMSDLSIRGASDPGFRHHVKWNLDLLDGYRPIFLGKAARRRTLGGFFSVIAPEVWAEVRKGQYDALIIHGHNYVANHLALAAARSIGLPVFMSCETHLGLDRRGVKAALRSRVMSAFYRNFHGFLAIGSANADFYRAMGVPPENIFLVPYSVDNQRFASMSAMTDQERSLLRGQWGVSDDRPIILFAAKLQPRKHPDDLIRACSQLIAEGLRFHLIIAGSGELETDLRAMTHTLPPETVRFIGFVNQKELPRIYGGCDVFVLPSTNEPWGLAINEAMASGLPVVTSREVGAASDLVRDGFNGRLFEARDIAGLASALRDVIAVPQRRHAMAQASRDIIARWSFSECLDGIRAALASIPSRPRRS